MPLPKQKIKIRKAPAEKPAAKPKPAEKPEKKGGK